MPRPSPKKQGKTKRCCKTFGCSTNLNHMDGHILCVICLDDTNFKPSFRKQQCPHCCSFNASSYRARQRRRKELIEGRGSQLGKGAAVNWVDYCIPRNRAHPHRPSLTYLRMSLGRESLLDPTLLPQSLVIFSVSSRWTWP